MRPATRSMRAPAITRSRDATSIMRLTDGRVVGRAFALDPDAQAVEHGVGIEWQFGSVHVADSLAQNAKILPTASGTTVSSPNVRASWFSARQPVQ